MFALSGILRTILTFFACLCFTIHPALSEKLSAFHGKWSDSSDPKSCQIAVGDPTQDAMTYSIAPKSIGYYEIDCMVQDEFNRHGGVDLNIDCFKGGGARWFEKLSIREVDQSHLVLKFSRTYDKPIILYRCPASDDEAGNASASATKTTYWKHNGSIMSLSGDGGGIEIDYLKPTNGLFPVGVRVGTMLFYGFKEGNKVSGTAYLFNKKCGPVAYEVSGNFSDDRHRLVMTGMAPRTNNKCEVVRQLPDALVFDRMP